MVGAVSTRRAARGITPSDCTPLPPITIGARACTIPSEPCSPRWPPWSSQLWAAEWSTQRSGAAGESKSWAVCSKANGYALSSRCGWSWARSASRPTNLSVDWSASGLRPVVATSREPAVVGALEGDAAARRQRLVAAVAAGEHHVDDRLERRVEQDLEGPVGRLPVLVGDLVRPCC